MDKSTGVKGVNWSNFMDELPRKREQQSKSQMQKAILDPFQQKMSKRQTNAYIKIIILTKYCIS